ncbi:formylglycine-generating enzyme family protein [bacterium]|nr:formylglycine-generating enzyme family protein [bacterium]
MSARQHFNEAKKHRKVFDYDSAINAIELVPEALLTSNMKSYLQSLESDRSELASLVSEIRTSIQKRDLDQLLPKVDRALKLKADHVDLNTLQQQLMTRKKKLDKKQDDACFEAAVLLADGNARSALDLVKRVQGELTSSQQELHDNLKGIVSAEAELSSLLKEAKADGVIEPKEVVELLLKTVDYLRLNPNHESIKTLKQNLQQQFSSCSGDVLVSLPKEIIAELPVPILAKLPAQTLGRLPAQVLSKLPGSVLAKLPAQVLFKLPGSVLAKLPALILKLPVVTNSIGMKLKMLPPGRFQMGSKSGQGDEKPQHEVTLTKPFMFGVHEVTQSLYSKVMGVNPSHFKGSNHPVEQVSWEDAVKFCQKLSALPAEKAAGHVYRLPTEAEWEYACRAGTTTEYSFGYAESQFPQYAWYADNADDKTHHVGGKKPNAWGLYDMHGNVWEWCQDWYGDYPGQAVTNPSGPTFGSIRVYRGGSWSHAAGICRSASRSRSGPSGRNGNRGFRVCLSPSGK